MNKISSKIYIFVIAKSRLFLMYRFLIFLFLLQASYSSITAQNQGKVRVYHRPMDAIVKLDTIKLENGKFIELDTGYYKIKAWAPKRELYTRLVRIDSAHFKTIRIDLDYSKKYKRYRYKVLAYRTNKIVLKFLPIAVYGIIALNTYQDLTQYEDDAERFKENTFSHKTAYESALFEPEFTFHKLRFQQNKANYDDALVNIEKAQNNLIISTVTAAVVTYFGWKVASKLEKPTYKETPLLSDFTLSPSLLNGNSALTLSCKLK